MSLQWLPTASVSAPPAAVTFHQEPTKMPSSFGGHGALAAQSLLLEQTPRTPSQEVNISRILRAIERPPAPDATTNQLNEGHRPSTQAAPPPLPPLQEEYLTHLLYPDSEEPSPSPSPPPVLVMPQPRPGPLDYPGPQLQPDYHRPHYQLGRPNKNLKPIHVSISQQTVNGLLSLLLLSVISLYGCMGTIFIMSALTVVESLQTRGNCYLVSLAMAHLLVTLLVIPSSALQIMAGDTLNGQRVCHYQWLTLEFSLIVSQLSFALIAADNYLGYMCSEKVVTQVASFVQGQQQANGDVAAATATATATTTTKPTTRPADCERRHLASTERAPGERPPVPGSSGVSPVVVATGKQAQYQTTAQSMQAEFLAQSAQVAARLEKSQEQRRHASRLAEKQSTSLIRRLFSNCSRPRRLALAFAFASQRDRATSTTGKTRVQHASQQANAQAQDTDNCMTRRESWYLKSSQSANATNSNHHHGAFGARPVNEWQDMSGGEPAGKSRRLARQFASETGSRLERPGGCVSYRNCCGRVRVLLWIACVWATALAYVLYQHELSFGARFCSTSGSNSYQWGPPSPNALNTNLPQQQQQRQLKFQSQPGKIGNSLASSSYSSSLAIVSPSPRLPLPSSGPGEALPVQSGAPTPPPNHDYQLAPGGQVPVGAASHGREQRTAARQLVAPIGHGGGGRGRVSREEANERGRREALLFRTVRASSSRTTEGLAWADNQSASELMRGERAIPAGPQSNPLGWAAPTEAGSAASRVDRAEVATGGHSSEVAATGASARANRNENENPVGAKNARVTESDRPTTTTTTTMTMRRLAADELLLRHRNDGAMSATSVILRDRASGLGQAQVQARVRVQVSRLRRDRDYASRAASLEEPRRVGADGRKVATKREGRADFIIQVRSMEPRNHFGAIARAAGLQGHRWPPSSSGAKHDEWRSMAARSDAHETNKTNSSGDASERALLQTSRPAEKLKDTGQRVHFARTVDAQQQQRQRQRRPTPTNERLDTKLARAPTAAAVHLHDDERDDGHDRHDGDDKTQPHARWASRTSQDQQQQLGLIDGSQRGASSALSDDDDDDELVAPRWRDENQQPERAASELNDAGHTGESRQLLVRLPVGDGAQFESRQSPLDDDDDDKEGDEEPRGHEWQPQTNNNHRGWDFSRFPSHNDEEDDDDDDDDGGELSSSSMSEIGDGGSAQNIDEQAKLERADGAALVSSEGDARPRTGAQIIMHATTTTTTTTMTGDSEPGREPDSAPKLIAAVTGPHSGPHSGQQSGQQHPGRGERGTDNGRESAARTTVLNDMPKLAASENNEFEGEKSWWPPTGAAATERQSSGGQGARASLGSSDSCHRNTRHLEASGSGLRGGSSRRLTRLASDGGGGVASKQIAIAQSQERDCDKFSDGSNNSSGEGDGGGGGGSARQVRADWGQQKEGAPGTRAGAARERACDNLNACDKQTIDRDKQHAHAFNSHSFGSVPGERRRPVAPARGPEERAGGHLLMNNNNSNNKLEMHSNGGGGGGGVVEGSRLGWTNDQAAGESQRRMQITEALSRVAGGANLRLSRQAQVAATGAVEGQLNLNPIDYGARPVGEASTQAPPRFPSELRQVSISSGSGGNPSTGNQHERRRDYFWHMLLCAVVAPSLLAALLFARAYIQMKEFKMRPYKPMPAAALNSTPPALLTPRSPIPLIAQRQVYAFDSPAGVSGGGGAATMPSNVTCVGSPAGGVAHEGEARSLGGDSRSGMSLAQTDDGDTEEDAGECLARAAQETVRRVSEITSEDSFKRRRRPLFRHAHSVVSEAGRPAAVALPPPAPLRLSYPTTNDAGRGKRQVNQVMSAPPPRTTMAGGGGIGGDCYSSPHEQHYPMPFNGKALPSMGYPPPLHLNGSAQAQWPGQPRQDLALDVPDSVAGPSFSHRAPGTAASYSAPPSARFQQQLVNYGPTSFAVSELQQQRASEPGQLLSNPSSRHRRQRHSSPVAYSTRALNSDYVSPIMESPQSFIGGSDNAGPHYQQHQQQQQQPPPHQEQLDQHHNPLNRHAQSFHYGTAAHHYRSYAARQADAQQQQPQLADCRTAQQPATLQARSGRNRLSLIESSRSSGEAADSTASGHQPALFVPGPDSDAAMSQALANVIRSVDDNGELTTATTYDKQQQQLSPTATVLGPNSGEPSAGSAASSLKRRLAPKPLELATVQSAKTVPPESSDSKSTPKNSKVILCTYSYMTDDQLLKSNMIVFLVHSAFWLPFVALCIAAQHRDSFTGELRDLVWWLAVLNCCSCSYLYALTNKDFREAFHKLFFYCFCQSHVTLQRKTPIFRRQLDVDRKGNLRVHIIPGLNVYSSKLFAASGGLRDGLGNDLSAFAASTQSSTHHAVSRPPLQPPTAAAAAAAAATRLTPNGLAPPLSGSIAPGH